MKKLLLISGVLMLFSYAATESCIAQNVGINTAGTTPDASALLDINAAPGNNKGLLIPRITTVQRNAIVSPALSLFIFNTTTNCFEAWMGSAWYSISCPGCTVGTPGAVTGPTSACSGQTGVGFSIVAVAGATSYTWTVPPGAVITAGQGTTSITVTFASISGNVSVTASSACATSPASNLTVNVNAPPSGTPSCGTQVFQAANLNVGVMIPSDGAHAGNQQTNNGIVEKYCYNNMLANCLTYGGLYEWDEAVGYTAGTVCDPCGMAGTQGICPSGFHIPTDLEFSRYEYCLENNISPTGTASLAAFQSGGGDGGTATAGIGVADKMKANICNATPWNGTNTSGFTALPAGFRNSADGTFQNLGGEAHFWTATPNAGIGDSRTLFSGSPAVTGNRFWPKSNGLSIRCMQN